MRRVCIEAGCPHTAVARSRCAYHARQYDARRQAKRGDLYTNPAYRKARAALLVEGASCQACGRTTDLTVDHVIAGDKDSPLRVLCRSCNSARANRARAARR